MDNKVSIIKSRVSMEDICHTYGININYGGYICCPFHHEKTPSMKIYPGNRGFCCFGCHESGDVIDFVQKYFGISFIEAQMRINNDFHLGIKFDADAKPRLSDKYKKRNRDREMAKRRFIEAAFNARYDYWQGQFARADRILMDKPKCIEDITDEYADAMRLRERACYELDQLEGEAYAIR